MREQKRQQAGPKTSHLSRSQQISVLVFLRSKRETVNSTCDRVFNHETDSSLCLIHVTVLAVYEASGYSSRAGASHDLGFPTSTKPWTAIDSTNNTMFPQRTMLRTSQRFASQLRSPAIRTPFQRRLASTESSGLHGAEDNAFNRERKAVKDHAAATSGAYCIRGSVDY
jgi:hypothetical protein